MARVSGGAGDRDHAALLRRLPALRQRALSRHDKKNKLCIILIKVYFDLVCEPEKKNTTHTMQIARDNSIPKFCRFYASHEQSTNLATNHYRIGVFWHPYESSRARSIRDPVNYPLHATASAQANPPDFAIHTRSQRRSGGGGRERVSFSKQLLDAEMKYTSPFYIERSRFDEFADYEMAYGNNKVPRWNIRAYEPSGQSLLPRVRTARATPSSNPEAYVKDVLDGFVRFADPTDRWTQDEWLDFVELEQSRLSAQASRGYDTDNSDELIGSLLAAQARSSPLEASNLFASMKMVAEIVVAKEVLMAQAPALRKVGIDQKSIDRDEFELNELAWQMLNVRAKYMSTGDIDIDDEPLAGFDSKHDLGYEVNELADDERIKLTPNDRISIGLMLVKLKPFVAKLPAQPRELDDLIFKRDELFKKTTPTPAQQKEKLKIVRRIAVLTSGGVTPVLNTATTIITEAERAKVAILDIRRDVKQSGETAQKATADAFAEKLAAKKKLDDAKLADEATKLKLKAEFDAADAKSTAATKTFNDLLDANIVKTTKAQILEKTTLVKLITVVNTINETIKDTKIPESVGRKLLPTVRTGEVYQRAVLLTMVDLVEKELERMRFLPDASDLNKLPQEDQEKLIRREHVRKGQVADAIATIENVRTQLRPSGAVYKLGAVAGQGTVHFAQASMDRKKPFLERNDVGYTYTASSDTQRGLNALLAQLN